MNRSVRDHTFTGRIDHRAGDRDSFFVRFAYEKFKLDAPQGQAACCLDTPAGRRGRVRPRPLRGRHPEHAPHHPRRRPSTGPTSSGRRGQRAAPGLTPRPTPRRGSRTTATESSTSLGIQGINVSEYTTGLPNLNIQDVTGISGGPAFLPVNPKQIHYQVEDTLSWVKGRHSLKTGYRFILRKPTPFTHTNTRSSIAINRNLTNNPQTNSQGSGLSTLLLGYTTGGSRGFLLDVYDYTNSEHSALRPGRLEAERAPHAQPGLRYEVYVPDTEAENRLPNYDPENRSSSTRAKTPPSARTRRRAGATSPRASAWPGT